MAVLSEVRQRNNLSQMEMSSKIGISQKALSLFETGSRLPTLRTRKKIESVFGKIDWFETFTGIAINNQSKYTKYAQSEIIVYAIVDFIKSGKDQQKRFELISEFIEEFKPNVRQKATRRIRTK